MQKRFDEYRNLAWKLEERTEALAQGLIRELTEEEMLFVSGGDDNEKTL